MLTLESKIENLPKIQKPQIAALKKLEIFTVKDLLLYFPYRYLDFSKAQEINKLQPGENVSIKATIKTIASRFSFRGRMSIAEAIVSDSTGSLKVTWFNQGYLAKSLKSGEEVFLSGKPDYYNGKLQLTNPLYEKVSDFPLHTARLVPMYHLKQAIYPKTIRNFIAATLPLAKDINETLPKDILEKQELMPIWETVNHSHFPEDLEKLEQAKKRLAFEEIFLNQLAAQKHKSEIAARKTWQIKFNEKLVKQFVNSLPFKLTPSQKKATWDTLQDLEKPIAMNRLIEGDVGSGKTLVAAIAALETVNSGLQSAFLVPTEVLASQHYQSLQKFLKPAMLKAAKQVSVAILTNSLSSLNGKEIEKTKLQALIKEGMPGIFIGTHALLEKKVKFKNPALIIIDEQHRFGVKQRAKLTETKGKVPHLLSLTATPIPRTLQLAFFGDLEVSQITEKPADRKPIITKLFNHISRPKAYQFIYNQIETGRQAFVITPLIEESETLDIKSAKSELENLQKIFPKLQIGLMHGKLKPAEKEQVMADFLAKKYQILVSTSVVEVGVDVPNASVIVIEGAERFGLAQLHQFRGRVGRSSHQSYCFLFASDDVTQRAQDPEKNPSLTRLEKFTKIQDGFMLAELDLKQRGFGNLYGSDQSGVDFKYFNESYTSLIAPAKAEAKHIISKDPKLKNYPELWEKIKNTLIHLE